MTGGAGAETDGTAGAAAGTTSDVEGIAVSSLRKTLHEYQSEHFKWGISCTY